MSVAEEILGALREVPLGLKRKEMFELCPSAIEEFEVGNQLKLLKEQGKVVLLSERKGSISAVYVLAERPESAAVAAVDAVGCEDGPVAIGAITQPLAVEEDLFYGADGVIREAIVAAADIDSDLEVHLAIDEALHGAAGVYSAPVDDHLAAILMHTQALMDKSRPHHVVLERDGKVEVLNQLAGLFSDVIAATLCAIAADLEAF